MGTYVNGVYVPALAETGWADEVNDFLTRTGELTVNVKAAPFGAVADGTTDDLGSFNAAVDAIDHGGAITGTIVVPPGRYGMSGPWVIGDGTKYVNVNIQTANPMWHASNSHGLLSAAVLIPSNNNADAIVLNAPASRTNSVVMDGISVSYNAVGTGIGLDTSQASQSTGWRFNNVTIDRAGVGVKVGGSVNNRFVNVTARACGTGWQFTEDVLSGNSPNVVQLVNCYAQSCVSRGILVDTLLEGALFESLVVQGNTGPGIEVSGGMENCTFISPWFEFPGTDMIRLTGQLATRSIENCTFIAPHFDGSGNTRHVIRIDAAPASSVFGRGITFIAPFLANIGSGRFLTVDTDPTLSTDPGFTDIHVIGGTIWEMKGLHTLSSGGHMNSFDSRTFTDSLVIASSVYGTKAPYQAIHNSQRVINRGDLGAIDFTELSSDVVAGSANHARLYARDNGAGKTQLVARFPSGVVQVIATEP